MLDGKPWVNALFEDREGTVWIGTRRESLYRARDSALRMRSLRDGLADPLVWSVIADGDGVLVGTNTSFHRLGADGRFSAVTARGALPQATVNTFARDADGGLWIGTRSGVTRLAQGAYAIPPELKPLTGKQVTAVVQVGPDDRWNRDARRSLPASRRHADHRDPGRRHRRDQGAPSAASRSR